LRLGHPQAALLFFDYTAKLAPRDEDCAVFSLDVLKQLGKHDEALARAKRYLSDPNTGLSLSVHSMSEVFRATRSLSEDEARPVYEGLIESLGKKLQRHDRNGAEDPETVAFGYLLLGACLESVGNHQQALAAYDSSTAVDPMAQHAYIAKSALSEKMREANEAEAGSEQSARNLRHRENRFNIVLTAEPPPPVAA
jgi:tetratricopeptide (TPR) repeat protein